MTDYIKTTNGYIRKDAIDIIEFGEHNGCEHTTKVITSTGLIRFVKGHLHDVAEKIMSDG